MADEAYTVDEMADRLGMERRLMRYYMEKLRKKRRIGMVKIERCCFYVKYPYIAEFLEVVKNG